MRTVLSLSLRKRTFTQFHSRSSIVHKESVFSVYYSLISVLSKILYHLQGVPEFWGLLRYFSLSLYARTWMHGICACTCVCVGQSLKLAAVLNPLLLYCLWDPELTDLAWPTATKPEKSSCLYLPSTCIKAWNPASHVGAGVLGVQA